MSVLTKAAGKLFNDKLDVLLTLFSHQRKTHYINQENAIGYLTALNLATFDNLIAIWKEKTVHDSVRPFTAIEYLYNMDNIKGGLILCNMNSYN